MEKKREEKEREKEKEKTERTSVVSCRVSVHARDEVRAACWTQTLTTRLKHTGKTPPFTGFTHFC